MSFTIAGLQQAQAANLRLINAIKPNNGFGRAVIYLATAVHRDMVAITHVQTGTLRASERMESQSALRCRIFIDPVAQNPVSGAYPALYGVIENGRGGSHAFAEIAVNRAPQHMEQAVNLIKGEF